MSVSVARKSRLQSSRTAKHAQIGTENYWQKYFTFETLNLHVRESTLEKIVPQGLIRNTEMRDWLLV